MGTAAAIGAGALGVGSIVSSVIGAKGAKSAAKTQSKAALRAGEIQAQSAERVAQLNIDASERAQALQREAGVEAGGILEGQGERAIGELRGAFGQTEQAFQPFREGGVQSFQIQQALSGALGPEAQAQAFQQFQESPNVSFLREQGLQGIDRQLAARGGLGGASRLKAISEFNQGLAQQDFQNQFNRLGSVTNVGLGATQSTEAARQQTGANIASSINQTARGRGNVLTGGAAGQASTLLGSAGAQGQALQQGAAGQAQGINLAGQARAQGTLGRAQAFQSGLSGLGSLAGFASGGGFGSPTIPGANFNSLTPIEIGGGIGLGGR